MRKVLRERERNGGECRVLYVDGGVEWVKRVACLVHASPPFSTPPSSSPLLSPSPPPQKSVEEEEEECSKALLLCPSWRLETVLGLRTFQDIRKEGVKKRIRMACNILRKENLPKTEREWKDALLHVHPDKWRSVSGKRLASKAFLLATEERRRFVQKKRREEKEDKEEDGGEEYFASDCILF